MNWYCKQLEKEAGLGSGIKDFFKDQKSSSLLMLKTLLQVLRNNYGLWRRALLFFQGRYKWSEADQKDLLNVLFVDNLKLIPMAIALGYLPPTPFPKIYNWFILWRIGKGLRVPTSPEEKKKWQDWFFENIIFPSPYADLVKKEREKNKQNYNISTKYQTPNSQTMQSQNVERGIDNQKEEDLIKVTACSWETLKIQ